MTDSHHICQATRWPHVVAWAGVAAVGAIFTCYTRSQLAIIAFWSLIAIVFLSFLEKYQVTVSNDLVTVERTTWYRRKIIRSFDIFQIDHIDIETNGPFDLQLEIILANGIAGEPLRFAKRDIPCLQKLLRLDDRKVRWRERPRS